MEEGELMQSSLSEMIEGNYQTVIYQLTKYLLNNQNSYFALVLRASAFSEKGEYSNAMNDFLSAEKLLTEPNSDIHYMKANTLFYNQNFEECKKELEKALAIEGVSNEKRDKINSLLNKTKFD